MNFDFTEEQKLFAESVRKFALANDDVKKRLAVEGAETLPTTPAQYAADIASEQAKWSEIIRKAGVKGE